MHDLVEHAPVVFVIGGTVNVCESNVPGILAAVTALPQFVADKYIMKSIAYKNEWMKWIAKRRSNVDGMLPTPRLTPEVAK